MKNKTITFFDNYNNYDYDQIKELLIEENIEENKNNLTWINYNPTDEQIEEYSYFLQDVDFGDIKELFNKYLKEHTLIVSCSNNSCINGYIIEDVSDFLKLIEEAYYIVIKEENNNLILNYSIYNSSFSYTELKELNKKGLDLINNNRYQKEFYLEDKDIKKLLSNQYSKKAMFSKNVGW